MSSPVFHRMIPQQCCHPATSRIFAATFPRQSTGSAPIRNLRTGAVLPVHLRRCQRRIPEETLTDRGRCSGNHAVRGSSPLRRDRITQNRHSSSARQGSCAAVRSADGYLLSGAQFALPSAAPISGERLPSYPQQPRRDSTDTSTREGKGTGTLNLRWTVEFAAAIAWQGASRLRRNPDEAAGPVWKAFETARQLASQWQVELRSSGGSPPDPDVSLTNDRRGQPSGDLLAEIVVTAMPVRLWAAVLCAGSCEDGSSTIASLGRSIAEQHSQLLTMALKFAATPGAVEDELFFPLNRLRRQTERWTDLLIGRYVVAYDLDDLAFDPVQARDFGRRQLDQSRRDPQRPVPEMVRAGLRLAFGDACPFRLPSTGLLTATAQGMLSAWDDEAFAAGQPLRRFRRVRSLLPTALRPAAIMRHPDRSKSQVTNSPSRSLMTSPTTTTPPLRVFPPPPTGLQLSSIRPETTLRPVNQRRIRGTSAAPTTPGFQLDPPR